ncbi:hypothetical protein SAMCCGM7_pC0717 (plasmid) [Sinorhizobium americanum CCGM7]|nr:hypothetical protein SAMCCGM7_pC0717 [Sinorhizobium americanum CCGM7]
MMHIEVNIGFVGQPAIRRLIRQLPLSTLVRPTRTSRVDP